MQISFVLRLKLALGIAVVCLAGTRLFEAGEVALAQTVQEEATRLLRSGSASDNAPKRARRGSQPLALAALILLLVVSTLFFSGRASAIQPGPTLLKRTVAISAKRYLRYWPNPSAAEPKYNTWSWTPQVYFEILGPVPGGSQWMFEVATPDGKPWVSFKLPTQEAGDDELVTIKGPDLDQNELEKKAITQTGLFPFKITLKNAVAGTNETISIHPLTQVVLTSSAGTAKPKTALAGVITNV